MHPREAFEANVEVTPGCWWWRGVVNRDNGYGRLWWDGRRALAHRVAWTLWHGEPVPAGLVVRHSCDNRECVNPHHLVVGTRAENSRDMVARGRSTRKTHCLRGHDLSETRRPNGKGCRKCAYIRVKERMASA